MRVKRRHGRGFRFDADFGRNRGLLSVDIHAEDRVDVVGAFVLGQVERLQSGGQAAVLRRPRRRSGLQARQGTRARDRLLAPAASARGHDRHDGRHHDNAQRTADHSQALLASRPRTLGLFKRLALSASLLAALRFG